MKDKVAEIREVLLFWVGWEGAPRGGRGAPICRFILTHPLRKILATPLIRSICNLTALFDFLDSAYSYLSFQCFLQTARGYMFWDLEVTRVILLLNWSWFRVLYVTISACRLFQPLFILIFPRGGVSKTAYNVKKILWWIHRGVFCGYFAKQMILNKIFDHRSILSLWWDLTNKLRFAEIFDRE